MMEEMYDVVAEESREATPSGAMEAEFSRNVAAADEEAFVYIPIFTGPDDDPGGRPHEHGPCRWMPRGETLPNKGDAALVIYADDDEGTGELWIVAWWPNA